MNELNTISCKPKNQARVRRLGDILPELDNSRTIEQEVMALKVAVTLLKERVFKLENRGKDE